MAQFSLAPKPPIIDPWGWTVKEIEFSLLSILGGHCLMVAPQEIFPWRFSLFALAVLVPQEISALV